MLYYDDGCYIFYSVWVWPIRIEVANSVYFSFVHIIYIYSDYLQRMETWTV